MRRINWAQIIITVVATGCITVIGGLIVSRLQAREPHVVFSTNETIPFKGKDQVVAIYQVSIINDGKRVAENIDCHIRIPGAIIEERRIKVDPSIEYTSQDKKHTIMLNFPLLNPTEKAQISILAKGPNDIPTRPKVVIRGKGVIGEEKYVKDESENLFNFVEYMTILAAIITGILTFNFSKDILRKKPIFYDDFESPSWQDYKRGEVKYSNEFVYQGNFSLKKDLNSDPNGGFKKLGIRVNLGVVFSGWLYRPFKSEGALGDRLAIEDANFNGYGFTVAHNSNLIWIERRDKGSPIVISKSIKCPVPMDKWYQFKFYTKKGGKFDLTLYDNSGKEFFKLIDVTDTNYKSFDRVVVHGGYPFYIDSLKVEKIYKGTKNSIIH